MDDHERVATKIAESPAPLASREAPHRTVAAYVRTTALVFLAICIVGIGPLIVVNGFFSALHVHLPQFSPLSLFVPDTNGRSDVALPRTEWTATRADVVQQPGESRRVATLEPGFPVTLTAHQQVQGVVWSHITWKGPTHAMGGSGWTLDSALVAYGGQARAIGDIGALSPRLLAAMESAGSTVSGALYFPDAGGLYRTRADDAFALGDGFGPLLLVTLFAQSEAPKPGGSPASSALLAASDKVAGGDDSTAAQAYKMVGDGAGVTAYLSSVGIMGIQPEQGNWRGAHATTSALLQFYTALDAKELLAGGDRATVLADLTHAASPLSTQLATILAPGAGGFLITDEIQAQGADGWTASVAGVLVRANGAHVVLAVAVHSQPDRSAAEGALLAFYRQLALLLAS